MKRTILFLCAAFMVLAITGCRTGVPAVTGTPVPNGATPAPGTRDDNMADAAQNAVPNTNPDLNPNLNPDANPNMNPGLNPNPEPFVNPDANPNATANAGAGVDNRGNDLINGMPELRDGAVTDRDGFIGNERAGGGVTVVE